MKNLAEQSLVEQTGMSEHEIARRLHHLDFGDDDKKRMRAIFPYAENALNKIVGDFYAAQLDDPEIATIIGDSDTLSKLKNTMRGYIASLFSAKYDESYANQRLRIGKVHKRLGVTPRLYISSLSTLQRLLDELIEESFSGDSDEQHKQSLHKILLFDAQLIFEAYINGFLVEMETAVGEVERYGASLGIEANSLTSHLHEISTKDALTGLYNRRAFNEHLERECQAAKRHNLPLSLAYIDLNNFKSVNDLHGHGAGDRILQHVGEAMLAVMRTVDIPARYGGDEFCIIMPRTKLDVVELPLNRLMRDFDSRRQYPVTFSIGVIQSGPDDIGHPLDLLKSADELMYVAKNRSKKIGGHQIEMSMFEQTFNEHRTRA